MNKSAIRDFAIESRKDLMEKINLKIKMYYADEKFDLEKDGDLYRLTNENHSLNLTEKEYKNRELLIKRINEVGIESVVEESAYTWFNRLIAIRYMEIHDYLPLGSNNESLGIRVLSSNDNTPNPEILKFGNLINAQLDINFDQSLYTNLNSDNEKFKYVLLLICSKLKKVFPAVFDGITDYIDLLIPENMLSDTGFISKMLKQLNEADFNKVEIIGWLYQYYNNDVKNNVFKDLKSNIKVTKKNIPAATQIFTPDWIVKYMVENTVGLVSDELKFSYKIDIDKESLNIREIKQNFEKTKFIDPCCGSGHILVYAFEVFYQLYEAAGYNKKDIVELILNNNLYGLDIDDRAGQLSILSVLLKAREYDKDIFNKTIDLNVMSIQESNNINFDSVKLTTTYEKYFNEIDLLFDYYKDSKSYGSLLNGVMIENSKEIIKSIDEDKSLFKNELNKIKQLLIQNSYLHDKYEFVITNPPYMSSNNMSSDLQDFLKKKYLISKSDLSTAMMERSQNLCQDNGFISMINIPVWMFLTSYEKLRKSILENNTIVSMLHNGRGIFGSDFGTVAFVLTNGYIENYKGLYKKLFDKPGDVEPEEIKINRFYDKKNEYYSSSNNFRMIPGYPIAYWASSEMLNAFSKSTVGDITYPIEGIKTGDNNRFLRFWWEVEKNSVGLLNENKKWVFTTKGGAYRKWYGNIEYVVNWENNGNTLKQYKGSSIYNDKYMNMSAITWTYLTAGSISFRNIGSGYLYNNKGPAVFGTDENILNYIMGMINSKVGTEALSYICSTLTFLPGDIRKLPLIIEKNNYDKIISIVKENISLVKNDWDKNEISHNFKEYVLAYNVIQQNYMEYKKDTENKILKLKTNEEEINKIFLSIYGLSNQIDYTVDDKDLSIKLKDEREYIIDLLSYIVGCMFGRYNESNLVTIDNNILEIKDKKDYVIDFDLVSKVLDFINAKFGSENFNNNIMYISDALGRKGTETPEDTIRRYFINDFYNDHLKKYQKHPIYWMIDSGKKNGFKALFYVHRYNNQLLSKVRVDYLHKTQDLYERLKNDINVMNDSENIDTETRKNNHNMINNIKDKIDECNQFDEKLGHLANQMINIDLDDGIKVNYEKLVDVLVKI